MSVDKNFIKQWKMNEEEIELINDLEQAEKENKIISATSSELAKINKTFKKTAKNTLKKMKQNKNITLRMNERVLTRIKTKTLEIGIIKPSSIKCYN